MPSRLHPLGLFPPLYVGHHCCYGPTNHVRWLRFDGREHFLEHQNLPRPQRETLIPICSTLKCAAREIDSRATMACGARWSGGQYRRTCARWSGGYAMALCAALGFLAGSGVRRCRAWVRWEDQQWHAFKILVEQRIPTAMVTLYRAHKAEVGDNIECDGA
jgi:hypothetical protein